MIRVTSGGHTVFAGSQYHDTEDRGFKFGRIDADGGTGYFGLTWSDAYYNGVVSGNEKIFYFHLGIRKDRYYDFTDGVQDTSGTNEDDINLDTMEIYFEDYGDQSNNLTFNTPDEKYADDSETLLDPSNNYNFCRFRNSGNPLGIISKNDHKTNVTGDIQPGSITNDLTFICASTYLFTAVVFGPPSFPAMSLTQVNNGLYAVYNRYSSYLSESMLPMNYEHLILFTRKPGTTNWIRMSEISGSLADQYDCTRSYTFLSSEFTFNEGWEYKIAARGWTGSLTSVGDTANYDEQDWHYENETMMNDYMTGEREWGCYNVSSNVNITSSGDVYYEENGITGIDMRGYWVSDICVYAKAHPDKKLSCF